MRGSHRRGDCQSHLGKYTPRSVESRDTSTLARPNPDGRQDKLGQCENSGCICLSDLSLVADISELVINMTNWQK